MLVEGMSCGHCSARVEKVLAAVEGVTAVQVDLEAKTATVTLAHPVEDSLLEHAVTEAGDQPVGFLSGDAQPLYPCDAGGGHELRPLLRPGGKGAGCLRMALLPSRSIWKAKTATVTWRTQWRIRCWEDAVTEAGYTPVSISDTRPKQQRRNCYEQEDRH